MQLRDLVEVNEQGMIHSSINFGLMDDPEKNLRLCQSYVFNYDRANPTASTIGVLDRVRQSFHSRNAANIHCMVMQYGKGKSHFGLVLANFFGKAYHSPEVQGILSQIKSSTVGHPAISESLNSFKKNLAKPYLVLCLSGDSGIIDLRKQFLKVLLKALNQAHLDTTALNQCAEPLAYLEGLSATEEEQANQWLEENGENYDIQSLIAALRQNITEVIPTVKAVCKHLTRITPEFNDHIDVEALLSTAIETYCTGQTAPFKGMLILFDEMHYYLERWESNAMAAGGTALQSITNLCEVYKGTLAFLSLTPIRVRTAVDISANVRNSYLKLSTRIAPQDTTYEPRSSLELVIDNLIIQKKNTSVWQAFEQKWRETFTAEARYLYERSGKTYLEAGWTELQIRQHLSEGVFPLHPYTAFLLANLSFTQDRTVLEFLRGTVASFIANEPAEAPGGSKPNYLYATTLVENFPGNYDRTLQSQYRTTLQALSRSENQDEYQVIQAIFLYWASSRKLSKNSDQEPHEVILGYLTGLSPLRLQFALDRLTNHYRVLYYNAASKLYTFYQGAKSRDLELEVERRARNLDRSISDIVGYAESKLKDFLQTETLPGLRFIQDKRLIQEEWQFEQRFVSSDGLDRYLTNAHSLQKLSQKGLVLYVLAESQEELQALQRTIEAHLDKSPVGDRVVVAIPNQGTEDLDWQLLKRKVLCQFDPQEQRTYGAAFQQLLEQWDKDIPRHLAQIIQACRYYCRGLASLTTQEQQQAHHLVSHLLAKRYPFAPTVQGNSALRPGHATGSQIVRFTAQKLFCNDLTDEHINVSRPRAAHENVIQGVYSQTWGLLNHQGHKYRVQVPTHRDLRQAWDYLSQAAKEAKAAGRSLPLLNLWQTLKAPPYGYSEYNFVVLLAGWLCHHNRTILLNGRTNLSGGRNVAVETQTLKLWAATDIFINPKTFVDEWIGTHRATIIFREGIEIPAPLTYPASWEKAQTYLEAVEKCLKSNEIEDSDKVKLHNFKEQVTQACAVVQTWLDPIETALSMASSTDISRLIDLYPRLWESPPALDMSGKPCVTPSQAQRDRQKAAQTQVRDRLEQLLTKGTAALPTIADCDQRQTHITQIQQQAEKLPETFPAFAASLNKALGDIASRRESLKRPTTSSTDRQIQSFLQRHPLPDTSPLLSHEQALQEVATLLAPLETNPQTNPSLIADLKTCQTQIQAQISDLQSRLNRLRTDLATVGDRPSFDRYRTTYAELALLYKGSSQEKQGQDLTEQLQKLESDLNRLDKLQLDLTAAQSVAACDRLQDKITQLTTQLHAPDQFQTVLATLQQQATEKAETWIQALETQAAKLQNLASLAEARSYQEDLLALRPRYQGSAEEPIFVALLEALNPWLDLFQILDTTPGNTLDQCQVKLKALNHWHQQQPELSPALQDLYRSHHYDLEQDIARLTEDHKTEALGWWQQINQESTAIVNLEGTQRFKLARIIQRKLKEEWDKHSCYLSTGQKESGEG
jgi:hypothetical protein